MQVATRTFVLIMASAAAAGACATAPPPDPDAAAAAVAARQDPVFTAVPSGTTALLQAVSVVSERVVWVSGHRGTFARSVNGGATWFSGSVPGADTLQFRDVHAVNADVAYLLAAGPGETSRIYRTTDGGRRWTLQFTNAEPGAFYDCFAFWDLQTGIAFSDAVDRRFLVQRTTDGGSTWRPVPDDALPAAQAGEGSFAASGTCVVAQPPGYGWIGTGNADTVRVLRTADRGARWTSAAVPIAGGEGAGIASLVFRDTLQGWAFGGRITGAPGTGSNVATTTDGGRSWRPAGRALDGAAVYGGAIVPGVDGPLLFAVGPRGTALSRDGGANWTRTDTLAFWSIAFASPRVGWAVGPGGRIARITFGPPPGDTIRVRR